MTAPIQTPPPNYQQLAAFIPTPDMVQRFWNLFKRVGELLVNVDDLLIRVTRIENKPRGGMRRTEATAPVTLGAGWTTIGDYQTHNFSDTIGITVDLAAGSLAIPVAGDYLMMVVLSATFSPNSSNERTYGFRLFDTTANVPIGISTIVTVGVKDDATIFNFAAPTPTNSADIINHAIVCQVSGGADTFNNFVFINGSFSLIKL